MWLRTLRSSLPVRWSSEGSAMDFAKSWEPFALVAAEEEIHSFVDVYAEKLSDDLYGEDLSVGELWSGTALADAAPFEPVVDYAVDGHDEGARSIRRRPPRYVFGAIGLTPSVRRSSPWLNSSRETCTWS